MNFSKLENNIFYVIKEQEIKLGYIKADTRLFYPLKSLNFLLETNLNLDTVILKLNSYFNKNNIYRGITASQSNEKIRLDIPSNIVEYIHNLEAVSSNFLNEFTALIQKENISFIEIFKLFNKYSSTIIKKIDSKDFDYIVYFKNQKPDDFIYCFKQESKYISYHRFTKNDFNELGIYNII